jgi:hypothetical protein
VCKEIDKTINQTIQNTLNRLESDCEMIQMKIDRILEEDATRGSLNLRSSIISFLLFLFGTFVGLLLAVSFFPMDFLDAHGFRVYVDPVETFWKQVPSKYEFQTRVTLGVGVLILLIASKLFSRKQETLSRRDRRLLQEKQKFVVSEVKPQKAKLYSEYLKQSVSDHDLM